MAFLTEIGLREGDAEDCLSQANTPSAPASGSARSKAVVDRDSSLKHTIFSKSPSTTGVTLKKFHKFGDLPPELRLMIWRHTMRGCVRFFRIKQAKKSQPKLAMIDGDYAFYPPTASISAAPVLLHVCVESRKEGLRFYLPTILTIAYQVPHTYATRTLVSYFAPSLDTLLFEDSARDYFGASPIVLGYNSHEYGPLGSMIKTFRSLAFRQYTWEQLSQSQNFIETLLRQYQMLEETVVYVHGYTSCWRYYKLLSDAEGKVSRVNYQRIKRREQLTDKFVQSLVHLCHQEAQKLPKLESLLTNKYEEESKRLYSVWDKQAKAWTEMQNPREGPIRKLPILKIVHNFKVETFKDMVVRVILQ